MIANNQAHSKRDEDTLDERVQLIVRVPKPLRRALKHAAVDRDTTVNGLVVTVLEKWLADQLSGGTAAGRVAVSIEQPKGKSK